MHSKDEIQRFRGLLGGHCKWMCSTCQVFLTEIQALPYMIRHLVRHSSHICSRELDCQTVSEVANKQVIWQQSVEAILGACVYKFGHILHILRLPSAVSTRLLPFFTSVFVISKQVGDISLSGQFEPTQFHE